ncbi:MAG TPA: hypothetical protein VKC99_07545 [Methyloceanibacter sp.]|nr:hypothetical protein [Methyloceanibacter sp.]
MDTAAKEGLSPEEEFWLAKPFFLHHARRTPALHSRVYRRNRLGCSRRASETARKSLRQWTWIMSANRLCDPPIGTFTPAKNRVSPDGVVDNDPNQEEVWQLLIKQSVARCACVSYNDPLGKKATVEQEIALHDKLVVSQPVHACYDEETEVLSENGWVRFADLAPSIRIAAVDPKTAQFTFEMPKLHTHDHDGTMLHTTGRSIDLLVTPNHRMLIQTRTSRRVAGRHEYIYSAQKIVEAKDLAGKQDRYMSSVRYVGGSKGNYWEGALEGFIIGDGYRQYGRIGFHLSKKRKIDFIKTVLSHLKIDYTVTQGQAPPQS